MPLADYIPQPLALLDDLRRQSPLAHSRVHGERHWYWVASIGAHLITKERLGDPVVVLLFALLHDARRQDEWNDPGHGERSAMDIARYAGTYFQLTQSQTHTLYTACATHTEGRHAANATIGVCWDADRLNLWRIRRQPLPHLLTTITAKQSDTIAWARQLLDRPMIWEHIITRYDALLDTKPNLLR
jgi:uncharacterized protein